MELLQLLLATTQMMTLLTLEKLLKFRYFTPQNVQQSSLITPVCHQYGI